VDPNLALREAAIRHCRLLSLRWGEAVPWRELRRGFLFEGQKFPLVSSEGIFGPKELTDGPLTLLSNLARGYRDEPLSADQLLYDYAPPERDFWNVKLKKLHSLGRGLILLKRVGEKPAEYMIFAPVFVLAFDDLARKFRLTLAGAAEDLSGIPVPPPALFSKAHAETTAMARLHQAHFRRETLDAYRGRCCVCELRERPLLDAAHIIPDRLPEGVPDVRNGLAMCATHHRAFDTGIVLVDEHFRVIVDRGRLAHVGDEATARSLLDFDTKEILLPKDENRRPEKHFLRKKMGLVA
jgi:putative restriction endonuclease